MPTPPEDLDELFDRLLRVLRSDLAEARRRDDTDGFRFWNGLVGTVEAIRRDLATDPRYVPEVRAYLVRGLELHPSRER